MHRRRTRSRATSYSIVLLQPLQNIRSRPADAAAVVVLLLGNRPTAARLRRTQVGRRVRRATSCALRRSVQAGKRSLTHGDKDTSTRRRRRSDSPPDVSSSFITTFNVWFRSFRAKLSRLARSCIRLPGKREGHFAQKAAIVRQGKPGEGGWYVIGDCISKPSMKTRRCESCLGNG
jgi:hypothetical protein